MRRSILVLSALALALSGCNSTKTNSNLVSSSDIIQSSNSETAAVVAKALAGNNGTNGKDSKSKLFVDDATGKLVLARADSTETYPVDDGKANVTLLRYNSTKEDGTPLALYLLDPASLGFKYQTFGQAVSIKNDIAKAETGYVNVGRRVVPADTATINAKYTGGALGTYDNDLVASYVDADLKWGADAKILAVTTRDSGVSSNFLQLDPDEKNDLRTDRRFDFTEVMNWDAKTQAFTSGDSRGYMYGPDAAEVGGTLTKQIDGIGYNAGFGAVKETPKP